MKSTFAVCITALLLCNYICSSDNAVLTSGLVDSSSSVVNKCTEASQCPYSDNCMPCDESLGPNCDQPTCIDGQCGVIPRCSQDTSPTTLAPNNQCSGTDTSNCTFHRLCALCIRGCTPFCTQVTCVDNKCQIIGVCSICPPTTTTMSTESSTTATVDQCQEDGQCIYPDFCLQCPDGSGPSCASAQCVDGKCQIIAPCSQDTPSSTIINDASSTSPTNQCQDDGQCVHPDFCRQCSDGSGPTCASAKCVDGQCQIIAPCSQKPQCTSQNLTQCGVRLVCLDCKIGLSPPCTQVSCVNGQCKVILPCSIVSESTTTPATKTCTSDGQCPHAEICAVRCSNGTSPRCASAKCVNGKCIQIGPCSQRACKIPATCPYNKKNCAPCAYGFGPGCEQPACSCGICSTISPCSKRIAYPSTPTTLKPIKTI